MNELQQSLSKCRVDGNIVYLPTEQLANYADVRKALMQAGASYKRNTFVFPNDAQPYMDKLIGGDSINFKKEFQFFETPPELGSYLVQCSSICEGDTVLEPSAGCGALIEQIYDLFPYYAKGPNDDPGVTVDYYELSDINQNVLSKKIASNPRWFGSTSCMGNDFLKADILSGIYDAVIANPPFSKNQDIDHIRKMYDCVKEGGSVVSIASNHWHLSGNKKEKEFKAWLDSLDSNVEEIKPGTFKNSGTLVGACIITINK